MKIYFRKICEYSSSLVKFQSQPWVLTAVSVLNTVSFRHTVLPMCSWCPMVYSISPIKLKYMGHSHVSLSSYRWADWFLNRVFKNYKKFRRKIYWNSYLICIFSFVFVYLNANCTHSLISPAVYFSGHCNWFRSKSKSCFWGAPKLRNYVLTHF